MNSLEQDLKETIALVAKANGITPSALVRGHGRASMEVPSRHAVLFLLWEAGHSPTKIAEAFCVTRGGVWANIQRATAPGSRASRAIEAARKFTQDQ